MTDPEIITIQPSNSPDGSYNVYKPWPYPYHVDAVTGEVGRQDFWKGAPIQVLGFQTDYDRHEIDLLWEDAAKDPQRIEGMFAVFLDISESEPTIYPFTYPIVGVTSETYTTPAKDTAK